MLIAKTASLNATNRQGHGAPRVSRPLPEPSMGREMSPRFAYVYGGNVQSHREWMTRSYALIFAAVTLRLYKQPLEGASASARIRGSTPGPAGSRTSSSPSGSSGRDCAATRRHRGRDRWRSSAVQHVAGVGDPWGKRFPPARRDYGATADGGRNRLARDQSRRRRRRARARARRGPPRSQRRQRVGGRAPKPDPDCDRQDPPLTEIDTVTGTGAPTS